MGFKKWRKKAEERSAWPIILKEVMVILVGSYVKGEEEEQEEKKIL